MPIKTRLALWYSGLLTLIIIIFSIAVITVSRVTLLQTVDQVLDATANTVFNSIDPVPVAEFGPPMNVQIFFRSEEIFFVSGISVQVWRTYDNNGEAIAPQLIRASDDIVDISTPLDPVLFSSEIVSFNSTTVGNLPRRVVTRPFLASDGEPLGVIQVATPLTSVINANDQLLLITMISATICIAVSVGLGMWLSRHLLRPIGQMTEAARSIANTEDLSTRLEWIGAHDELGEMTHVFNQMMTRLEHLFGVQQRFIGDVSHELRTPLTTIIGNVELIQRYGYDQSSIEAIERDAARMNRMVNDLLLLTRADAGELEVDFYPVDLDAIAVEVYEQTLSITRKRDLQIVMDRIEPVRITGNADRLRQLLLNVMNNAVKFTRDGGKIALGVYPADGDACITIQDTGIGISEADSKRIFDRFFQADSSRYHRDEADGSGLGLSIARWIVDIHGGTIEVQSQVDKGTRFLIRLPMDSHHRPNKDHAQPSHYGQTVRITHRADASNN